MCVEMRNTQLLPRRGRVVGLERHLYITVAARADGMACLSDPLVLRLSFEGLPGSEVQDVRGDALRLYVVRSQRTA